jgi:hypothetical protein
MPRLARRHCRCRLIPPASACHPPGQEPLATGPLGELPGFADDLLHEAWNAWLKSCERPGPSFARLCPEVRRLSIGSPAEQRAWMMQRLQPYRVESLQGPSDGLLTGYYEPMLEASRVATAANTVPLYGPPGNLASRKPWYTRQEMDTLPEAGQRCADARSPGWPTRWMRWCCRSRDPGVCASSSLTAVGGWCGWLLPRLTSTLIAALEMACPAGCHP